MSEDCDHEDIEFGSAVELSTDVYEIPISCKNCNATGTVVVTGNSFEWDAKEEDDAENLNLKEKLMRI